MQTRKSPQKNVKKAPKQNKKQQKKRLNPLVKTIIGVCCICAALVGVFLAPAPYTQMEGGITLIGNEPDVSVYGPELPLNYIEGYSVPAATKTVVIEEEVEDNTLYVYAADGAERYHLGTCKFAFASAHRLTIMEAHFLGYEACGRCDPPTYAEYYG